MNRFPLVLFIHSFLTFQIYSLAFLFLLHAPKGSLPGAKLVRFITVSFRLKSAHGSHWQGVGNGKRESLGVFIPLDPCAWAWLRDDCILCQRPPFLPVTLFHTYSYGSFWVTCRLRQEQLSHSVPAADPLCFTSLRGLCSTTSHPSVGRRPIPSWLAKASHCL